MSTPVTQTETPGRAATTTSSNTIFERGGFLGGAGCRFLPELVENLDLEAAGRAERLDR